MDEVCGTYEGGKETHAIFWWETRWN